MDPTSISGQGDPKMEEPNLAAGSINHRRSRIQVVVDLPPNTFVRLQIESYNSQDPLSQTTVTSHVLENQENFPQKIQVNFQTEASLDGIPNGFSQAAPATVLTSEEIHQDLPGVKPSISLPALKQAADVHNYDQIAIPETAQAVPAEAGETGDSSPGGLVHRELLAGSEIMGKSQPTEAASPLNRWFFRRFHLKIPALPAVLIGGTIFIYLLVRVIGLVSFPIYYSCDEAASVVLASDLLHKGLYDDYGELLPTFFKNDNQYGWGWDVYVQAVPYLIFGKSVWISRFTMILISLAGALWLGLILRDGFNIRHWWLGTLLLSVTPAWFLHSRTGFPLVMMVAFFAGFLYYYVLYRYKNPKYIYLSLVMGAITFYSYHGGQILIVVTALLLLISDFRYHWQQRKTSIRAMGVLFILILPFIRFWILHPGEYASELSMYQSYVVQTSSFLDKFFTFIGNYFAGLNPRFWFFYTGEDLPRYIMKGYGNIAWPMLPLMLIGLGLAFRQFRQSNYRLVLIALFASPIGSALVTLTVYRSLMIVIPVIILATIGLCCVIDWVVKLLRQMRGRLTMVVENAIIVGVFVVVAGFNLAMLRDALINGPTWYQDYGISGMQYGASQVFGAARILAVKNPGLQIQVSPNWTFQAENVRSFFVDDVPNIIIGTPDAYIDDFKPDLDNKLFVLTPDDYQHVLTANRFKIPVIDQIIKYPNQQPGFYFVRLAYRDDIQTILQQEKQLRHQLVHGQITLNGELVDIGYSKLDGMSIENAFDGSLDSHIKTYDANPLELDLVFPKPRMMEGLTVKVGGEPVNLSADVYADNVSTPIHYEKLATEVAAYKNVRLDFNPAMAVKRIHITILDVDAPDPSPVHLWEVTFNYPPQ